eukprot:1592297-Amphidinium_carterae.1
MLKSPLFSVRISLCAGAVRATKEQLKAQHDKEKPSQEEDSRGGSQDEARRGTRKRHNQGKRNE